MQPSDFREIDPTRRRDVDRRCMEAIVAVMRDHLLACIAWLADPAGREAIGFEAARFIDACSAPAGAASIEGVVRSFTLSEFEARLLALCAACEHAPELADLCGVAHGDRGIAYPTFHVAAQMFPLPDAGVLHPATPLRRWSLIHIIDTGHLPTSPLRIDERLYHHLLGEMYLDAPLSDLLEPIAAVGPLVPTAVALADEVARHRMMAHPAGGAVQIHGASAPDRRAVGALVAARCGARALAMRASEIPDNPHERVRLQTLIDREGRLEPLLLLVECDGMPPARIESAVVPFVSALGASVLIAASDPLGAVVNGLVRFGIVRPSIDEQIAQWQSALGPAADSLNGAVDHAVAHFNLGAAGIQAVAARLRVQCTDEPDAGAALLMWDACRAQARPRLDDLAQRIEPRADWNDLVLPDVQAGTIREIAAHVRQRLTVYERWGFAARSNRGLGISAMFAGPSGTGKTMAAEVLAGELRLDLYHIDLSQVVSKYIGETEKNLRRIFDAAEEGGAVLLFDEADALFGKRSEVKDSHDRHANIEVSYLLQRMESYRGLAILTTNMKQAMDTAFLRRLRFVVDFPFPDAPERTAIWRRIFPPGVPTSGIDPERLSRLNVAGGNIRNIALNAAFLAADERVPVGMRHLLRATRSEYLKLEKQLTDFEIGGWV